MTDRTEEAQALLGAINQARGEGRLSDYVQGGSMLTPPPAPIAVRVVGDAPPTIGQTSEELVESAQDRARVAAELRAEADALDGGAA